MAALFIHQAKIIKKISFLGDDSTSLMVQTEIRLQILTPTRKYADERNQNEKRTFSIWEWF